MISPWAGPLPATTWRSTRCPKLSDVFDERQWAGLDATLEAAPVLLARHDPMVAATIYGYLERSPPPVGQMGVDIRGLSTEVIEAYPTPTFTAPEVPR